MILVDNDEMRRDKIRRIKRHCLLCVARSSLRPGKEPEREIVLKELTELKETYNDLYNQFRAENKSVEEIKSAIDNKRVCMDAIELCQKCKKDFERVNRFLSGR